MHRDCQQKVSRRTFVRCATAAATIPMIVSPRVFGADAPSNQITLGLIGTGIHGSGWNLDGFKKCKDARILAVCDVMQSRREATRAKVNEHHDNNDCTAHADWREVIVRKDIDAVMISTPDHWHVPMAAAASKAGKDVCCEKPTLTIAGVEKTALRPVMGYISDLQLSTLATGGDFGCNIMCCPAPHRHACANDDLQITADKLDACLTPQVRAYDDIWQIDRPSGFRKSLRTKSPNDDLEVVKLVSSIVAVYREFGNRSDHSRARLKYLIRDWGIDQFKQAVEDRSGPLEPPRSIDVAGHDDHLGWHRQNDKKWFVGIHVENGCIYDGSNSKLKSALRRIADRFACSCRLTPQRHILASGVDSSDCLKVDALLAHRDVPAIGSLNNVRRYSTACPGLPSCSSAITESQRMLPGIMTELESEILRLGLGQERFTLRVAGCPFGCKRCYLADIAIVGRTMDPKTKQDKYAIFLGGDRLGRRLNTLYKDLVPADQVMATLRPLLLDFRRQRFPGEALGDFFVRMGS